MRQIARPGSRLSCGPCPGRWRIMRDRAAGGGRRAGTGPRGGISTVPGRDRDMATGSRHLARGLPDRRRIRPVIPRRLAAAGEPVSRRALRHGGLTGSNQACCSAGLDLADALTAGAEPGGRAASRRT
jgi:hypothetical protein